MEVRGWSRREVRGWSRMEGRGLTVDVVGVDILDGGSADVSRLGPESDAPQLVHPTQLETQNQGDDHF